MSEERLNKIKFTTILGFVIGMVAIASLQLATRAVMSSRNSGIEFGELHVTSMIKSMALFGAMGAISGFIAGYATPLDNEKPVPTKRPVEGEEDDGDAAKETLAKLGISRDRDKES